MNSTETITWELRVSNRARYARLLIKPYGGLEVVIPPRFPRRDVPRLVEKHADWIRHQLDKQSAIRDSIQLPQEINLGFDNSHTVVVYNEGKRRTQPGCLFVKASDYQGSVKQLRAWIRKQAWGKFPEMLANLSAYTGLDYQKLSIRSQKTRWGSCSIRGSISLNDQLLFLPQEAAEYLMIHELCHTRHLNHSPAFWELVEFHCPDFRSQERTLSQARHAIPEWFLRDLYR
jgi:predicted metal-dependent hydrolase